MGPRQLVALFGRGTGPKNATTMSWESPLLSLKLAGITFKLTLSIKTIGFKRISDAANRTSTPA